MLANGGVGALPVSQKNRNVRSSRSAKNGSTATEAEDGARRLNPAQALPMALRPKPPAAMLANGGVGALPVSQKKRTYAPQDPRRSDPRPREAEEEHAD